MYSKFILQIFLLSQLADLQCGMATIRKLQFRFACDSEHFWPFGFKFFIFRHIFLAILYFFIGFILRQAYTAREAEDLGKASLSVYACRQQSDGSAMHAADGHPGNASLCRICLPRVNQWQCNASRAAITRKFRAKASCR